MGRRMKESADDLLVQILDGDGNPITQKMKTSEFTRRSNKIARGIGDNSQNIEVHGEKLEGFLKNLERLHARKSQISQEISEAFANIKAVGYDTKTVRRILKTRKDPEKTKEEETIYEIYMSALNLLAK